MSHPLLLKNFYIIMTSIGGWGLSQSLFSSIYALMRQVFRFSKKSLVPTLSAELFRSKGDIYLFQFWNSKVFLSSKTHRRLNCHSFAITRPVPNDITSKYMNFNLQNLFFSVQAFMFLLFFCIILLRQSCLTLDISHHTRISKDSRLHWQKQSSYLQKYCCPAV